MSQAIEDLLISPEWMLCSKCRTIVYGRRWIRSVMVCPECGHHTSLDARTRLEQLADPDSIQLVEVPTGAVPDVLGFIDTMPYPQRLAEARAKTGMDGAVLVARARIKGAPVVLAVMDFRFLGGSLGAVAGDAICRAGAAALADRVPLMVVTASGGARMQEGAISLMQMAKTSSVWAELDEAGLLTVSLITDPTFGGVAASFASLSDVIIGEKGARLGFAGRRVIEQTIRQQLPADFQTVEFMLKRGFVDLVVARESLRDVLGRVLRFGRGSESSHVVDGREAVEGRDVESLDVEDPIVREPRLLADQEPWRQVRRARDLTRPTTLDYISLALDDFQELHGDRLSGECSAIVAGIAHLDGRPVVVIGHQKGHTAGELADRSFGMPSPAGYRKAARMMRLAAKLGIPVLTLVDTPGAYPGAAAEEQGQASAIAENLRLMASLPVPVVTVVTGEGGSGGALGIAVANRVLIWEHGVYSVISPEGCASILWGDPGKSATAAAALGLGSRELLRLGVVDGVLPEPEGGTGADPISAAELLRASWRISLAQLSSLSPAELIADRRRRFARFGSPTPPPPPLVAVTSSKRGTL